MRIGNKLVLGKRYVKGSLRMNLECENMCVLCNAHQKAFTSEFFFTQVSMMTLLISVLGTL